MLKELLLARLAILWLSRTPSCNLASLCPEDKDLTNGAHLTFASGPHFLLLLDLSPGIQTPEFETPYEVTHYKDSRFHAISMMRAYKKYSFEELRVAYPLKRTLKTENILVAHANKGRSNDISIILLSDTLFQTLNQGCKLDGFLFEFAKNLHVRVGVLHFQFF